MRGKFVSGSESPLEGVMAMKLPAALAVLATGVPASAVIIDAPNIGVSKMIPITRKFTLNGKTAEAHPALITIMPTFSSPGICRVWNATWRLHTAAMHGPAGCSWNMECETLPE
jgi:hypothetical protein